MVDPRSWPHRPPPEPPANWPDRLPVWPVDPAGPADDDESLGPRRRPRWVAAVAIGLVVALIAAYGAQVLIGDDDPVVAAPGSTVAPPDTTEPSPPTTEPPAGSTPPSTEPPAADDPPPADPPTDLDAVVDDLVDFVEEAREAEFLTDPVVEFYDDAGFEQRTVETFLDEETIELTEIEGNLYHALGLLDPEVSMEDLVTDLLASGVVGFYDPETAELAVRGTDLNPYVASTVVHELVHALDDQLHDLDRPEWDELTIDESNAVTAVVEGNARRVEAEWIATLSEAERVEYGQGEAAAAGDADYGDFPQWLVELLLAPYELGEVLVSGLDSEAEIDALFDDPPESTEQVLDPEAFAVDEQPAPVPVPGADGAVVDEGTLGALMLYLMVFDTVGVAEATSLASGWGGDAYVVYEDGDRVCVTLDVVGDSAGETASIASSLRAYADASGADASVETVGGGTPRLSSCATPA
jgi:hypothetical protein